jgi:threonine aldolase
VYGRSIEAVPNDDLPVTRTVSMALSPKRAPGEVLSRLVDRLIAGESEPDAVPRLERRLAELLGKPAAAMFPSGTMAQQVAMRIHADRRGVRTVAWHPQCHLEEHEHKGYALAHGLASVLVGNRYELITMADLAEVVEPIAALLLELPQREIGGRLPEWNDLVAQTEWARDRGAAVHMDGARLWESQPFYGRPHAEIAGLFDTVYVSLYKGLMGISGGLLAGPVEIIEQARRWRDRLGGDVSRNWPMAMTAERGLDELLPRMAEFADRARKLAAVFAEIPGVRVVPDPPQTPMFHLHIDAPALAVKVAGRQLHAETGIAPPRYAMVLATPGRSGIELTVSEQLDDVTDDEVTDLVRELVARARG